MRILRPSTNFEALTALHLRGLLATDLHASSQPLLLEPYLYNGRADEPP